MPISLKIAAVFATMNREETALACVKALAAQTRPPDLVVVADNVSSDNTVSSLRELSDLPFVLKVLELDQNQGNAGGVEAAMEYAFRESSDAVWILDDDSWPRPEALAAMLDKDWNPEVVRHAMQINPKTGNFTWPLQVANGRGGWKLVEKMEDMPPGDFVGSRIIWTGALVPWRVREATGPVNGSLFIRGEDEEYPWRIEAAGFTQEAVRYALLDHPGPDDLVHWSFGGKNLYFERGLADWKLYYKIRNMIWLKRQQAGTSRAVMMAVAYSSVVAILDGPHRLDLVMEAVVDGWKGAARPLEKTYLNLVSIMISDLKSLIRMAFYRFAVVRAVVGCASVLIGRTKALGMSHLLSYREDDAIGPLQRDEAIALFGIVRTVQPSTVVEFGFFHGHSAYNFLCALSPDARLFSYDVDGESERRARNEFRFDRRFTFLPKSQTDFDPEDVGGRQVDLVFFDAAHEIDLNIPTFERILPCLADDALIAIHDTGLWHRKHLTLAHQSFIQEVPGIWLSEDLYAHQPDERDFIDWIVTSHPEFAALHLHSTATLRHGLTLLQRQRILGKGRCEATSH